MRRYAVPEGPSWWREFIRRYRGIPAPDILDRLERLDTLREENLRRLRQDADEADAEIRRLRQR